MNDYLLSLLLGVIEGLTEFLPVSSTAHLRIAEAFLGIDLGNGYWKMFSIVIQLGAILCLPLYFWNRIVEFAHDFPHGKNGDRTVINHPLTLTLIAFVVTAIPAFLLTKIIGKHLESLPLMAWSLIIGGIVMWVVDAVYERSKHRAFARGKLTEDMEQMSVGQAVWIGFCQIFSAVFPGTSRSMSTITAGRTRRNEPSFGAGIFVLPFHPDHGGRHLLRPVQVAAASSRPAQRHWLHAQRCAFLGVAGHRVRGFVYRRLRRGGVVHELGPHPRFHGVRHLPHRIGRGRAVVGGRDTQVGPLMVRAQAIELVRQLEQAINAHDTRRLLDFYADNPVAVSPMFPGISGRDAIAKGFDTVFSLFPDWTVSVSDVLVDGDRIAFMGSVAATDRNGWFGEPPTGERFGYPAVIVLTVVEGKIVRDERIYDLTGLLQRREKTRLDKELEMAAEVQRALLSRTKHSTSYCEAVGDSIPCRAIGGDFFEFIHLPSGDFGVVLGDVSGKGPASAIVAAMIQGMLAVEVQTESGPAAILTRLNGALARRGLEPRFATLVYGVLSPSGRFVYSNAGHNPPLLLTRNGVRRLTTGGPILGAFHESQFEEETVCLSEGDTIVLFSDGVTEARDTHDHEFGEEGLISCAASHGSGPAVDMLNGILRSVQEFCQGTTQTDDITVSVIQFHKS